MLLRGGRSSQANYGIEGVSTNSGARFAEEGKPDQKQKNSPKKAISVLEGQ
jgi:hypothetical protein